MNPGGSGFYWDSANPTPVIEFTVSSSTVTVSTSGVCKVLFPKQGTNGLMQELDLSGRSYSCNFSTYPVSALCGITDADWASSMPWFVYLANANNTAAGVYCFVSRDPRMSVTPAAGLINDTEAVGATAQSQRHINSFTTDALSTAAVPCLCIGSLTMKYAVGTHLWTPDALASTDGFGKFQEGVKFTMPVGQNGSQAGKLFTVADGATALVFSPTTEAYYYLDRDGFCTLLHTHVTQDTPGADGTQIRWVAPYTGSRAGSSACHGNGVALLNNVIADVTPSMTDTSYVSCNYTTTAALGPLNDNTFANTADYIYFNIEYKAF